MKKFYYLFFLFYLSSCVKTTLTQKDRAHQNAVHIEYLKIGMNEHQVLSIMGVPDSRNHYIIKNEVYSVWFYATQARNFQGDEFLLENFTPLIFKKNHLLGWGYDKYHQILKEKEEEKIEYTIDEEEWPREDHQFLIPEKEKPKIPEELKKQEEKALQKYIEEKEIEEVLESEKHLQPSEEQAEEEQIPQPSEEQAEEKQIPQPSEEQADEEQPPECEMADPEDKKENYHWLD